jgi:hypothetical protein
MGKKRESVAFSYYFEFGILVLSAFLLSCLLMAFAVGAFSAPISQYLYAAEESSLFQSENADRYLFGEESDTVQAQRKIGFWYLFRAYIIPNILFTGAVTVFLLLLLGGIVLLYVRDIHPMYDAGGKE